MTQFPLCDVSSLTWNETNALVELFQENLALERKDGVRLLVEV